MSCEQCAQGYVIQGEPQGSMVNGAYLKEGPNKSRAVVLLTDIFGLPLVNCKLIADEISKNLECDVWVPDLFNGAPPFKVEEIEPLMPHRAGQKMPWWNYLRAFFVLLPRFPRLYANRASVVDPRVESFIAKIRDERKYEKVGAVGYCFGGSVGIRFGSKGLLNSLVIAHPGRCTIQEIEAIKIPTAWVLAEEDMSFSDQLRKQAEESFAKRKGTPNEVDYEFKVYKGTAHGFAARPNLAEPDLAQAYHDALKQTIDWFKKTL
ncbi:dienelactone hydrolase endo-1-3,1,4-beta-D-glucanase [Panus rudis PR-1116 ss-1]|nr:dienelactone hydrolase endo-1-3,1,4-beta-D-glucanase [Panus rudis PR-1116 ss-1]